jgi:hypothetical protein
MRVIETKVYTFDELDPKAKEAARDWLRELEAEEFASTVDYEDFETCAACLGIEFDRRNPTTEGPAILWSGFASQGDGACFEGLYRYKPGALAAIKAHAPQDEELHRIARELAAVQRRHFYGLTARVTHDSSMRYVHDRTVDIDVQNAHGVWMNDADGKEIGELLRAFMRWMYRQLETDYDYRQSAEAIDESMEANGYEFTAEGRRAAV